MPEDAFAFSPDPAGREPWNPDTMTHRYRRYARRVGITSSLKELRHYSATQLLAAGTDLNTVAGRLGHAEGSTTLKFYAQFTRPADQGAATVIPSQLDGLRKKERLRELYQQHMPASGADGLAALAAVMAAKLGLTNIPLLRGSQSSHLRIRLSKDRLMRLWTAWTACHIAGQGSSGHLIVQANRGSVAGSGGQS